jgi:perosamine synthetase
MSSSVRSRVRKSIPVCAPFLGGRERDYVLDAVASNWISSRGSYLERFEQEFPVYVGMKYGTATCNGTQALHLALRALGIGPGDEVILPTFTMVASAFAICYCGATPVLLDCDPQDWNLNTSLLESAITHKTKAIMVVHIYGHSTNMDPVMELARQRGLLVVEDAAEAHGSEYKGRRCGSFGHVSCFSFFANKNMTCGEGGMALTNDAAIFSRLRYLKNLSFPLSNTRVYDHNEIGYNYRMSNVHAAIGCAQLERLDDYVAMRRRVAVSYSERLGDIPGIRLPIERPWAKNTFWMYAILCEKEFGIGRDQLMADLAERCIETRPFFKPMHLQKALCDYGFRAPFPMPVSETISKTGLYLPSSSSLQPEDIDYICDAIRDVHLANRY